MRISDLSDVWSHPISKNNLTTLDDDIRYSINQRFVLNVTSRKTASGKYLCLSRCRCSSQVVYVVSVYR